MGRKPLPGGGAAEEAAVEGKNEPAKATKPLLGRHLAPIPLPTKAISRSNWEPRQLRSWHRGQKSQPLRLFTAILARLPPLQTSTPQFPTPSPRGRPFLPPKNGFHAGAANMAQSTEIQPEPWSEERPNSGYSAETSEPAPVVATPVAEIPFEPPQESPPRPAQTTDESRTRSRKGGWWGMRRRGQELP